MIAVEGEQGLLLYWAIALITSLLSRFAYDFGKDRWVSGILQLVAAMPAAVFAAFRYSSGTDTLLIYHPIYTSVTQGVSTLVDSARGIESGYVLLNSLAGWLGLGFPGVLFLSSILTVLPVIVVAGRFKDRLSAPIAVWVYMMLFFPLSFNAVRQMISISLFLIAFSWLGKKNTHRAVFWIIVAAFFHKMALLYLAVPVFRSLFQKREYRIARIAIYLILLGLVLGFSSIQTLLVQFDSISYYAASYLRSTDSTGISIGLFVRTLPFLIPIVFLGKESKDTDFFRLIFSLVVVGAILRILAYVTSTYAERIAYDFLVFEPFLIGYYVLFIRRFRVAILAILILFVFFLSFYDYLFLGIGEVIPYTLYIP